MNAARRVSLFAFAVFVISPVLLFGQPPPRKDAYGDVLPHGAIKRLGTTRLQHLRSVRQVAFTADGKRLITIGDDFVCSTWDLTTGKEVRREVWGDPKMPLDVLLANERIAMLLLGRGDASHRHVMASLSADGRFLVLCREEKMRVLDVETGAQVSETPFKIGKTSAFELSPDGKSVARFALLQDYEPELSILEVGSGKQLHKFRNVRYYNGMRFSPDGKFLAARDNSNQIGLFNLATNKRIRLFEGHEGQITGMLFAPNDTKLASAATDGVFLWDQSSDDALTKFPLDDIGTCTAAFSPNGKVLATSGKQNAIFLWDVAAASQTRALAGHTGQITALAFSPDGKRLASGAGDGTIRLWDATNGAEITPCKHLPRVQPLSLVKRGVILAQADSATTLHHLSETTGEITATFPGPSGPPLQPGMQPHMAVSPNGKFLALVDMEMPTIKLWNVPENREAFRLEGHSTRVNRIAFSSDSEHLATLCTQDRTMRVWSTRDGKTVHKFDLPFFNNEEQQLVFRARFAQPQPIFELQIHDIAFSPDRRSVTCIAPDGMAYQWEMASGKLRSRIPIGARNVSQLTYSPNGRLIAAVTNEDTVRICDVVEGKLVHGFVGRYGEVRSITFSPDNRLLAAGNVSGRIVIYDVHAGKEVRTFHGHQNAAQRLWFVDDGKTLVSASTDGTIVYWDMNSPLPPPQSEKGPDDAQLAALWTRLGHAEAIEAFDAVGELARHPQTAVKFLKTKLEPTPTMPAERVTQLLANLDSSNFAVREKASDELRKSADQILPVLKKALSESSSSEKNRRIHEIMEKAHEQRTSPNNLRLARAVEVLERVGDADALAFLENLAGGAPDALVTTAARDAVQRLRQNP